MSLSSDQPFDVERALVRLNWRRTHATRCVGVQGVPGVRASDLIRLAILTANGGQATSNGWPTAPVIASYGDPHFLIELPGDNGVLLGNLTSLGDATAQVDAVVSLRRVGAEQVPADLDRHQVWLVDQDGDDANPNLRFVLDDTVEAITTLRAEGKCVFLHCAVGASRTPAVAAAYLAKFEDITVTEALDRVAAVIPFHNRHNTTLLQGIERS